jgi:hypothetical protein
VLFKSVDKFRRGIPQVESSQTTYLRDETITNNIKSKRFSFSAWAKSNFFLVQLLVAEIISQKFSKSVSSVTCFSYSFINLIFAIHYRMVPAKIILYDIFSHHIFKRFAMVVFEVFKLGWSKSGILFKLV